MEIDLSKFKVIRGQRILDQLNETTYDDLYGNIEKGFPTTRKRQYATDPIRIVGMNMVPYVPSKRLMINGVANSSGKIYKPMVVIRDLTFEDDDTPNNVTFTASDNREYHIKPIKLADNNLRVRCNCMDFYWRFANYNHPDGSLWGPKPPPYKKKTNRPPVNPMQVPGVCKHLIKLIDSLRDSGLILD